MANPDSIENLTPAPPLRQLAYHPLFAGEAGLQASGAQSTVKQSPTPQQGERGEEKQQLEQAYQDIQDERLRYQELFEFVADGYLLTDLQGVIQAANHAAASLLQARKEFLQGKPLSFFMAPGWRTTFYHRLTRLRQSQAIEHWKACLGTHRNGLRDVAVTAGAVPSHEGRPIALRWLLQDLGPMQRAERALQAEKTFADRVVEEAEAIILSVGATGRVIRSNPYLHQITGQRPDELLGREWSSALLSDVDQASGRRMVQEALVRGTSQGGILRIHGSGGIPRTVRWSAWSLSGTDQESIIILLGQDITDSQEAQQRALQVERLAAIGEMIAGIAHEGRNALQRTLACLERLKWGLQDRPEALDLVLRAQSAQDDLRRLLEDVGTYGAPLTLDRTTCNLADVWREIWQDVASRFPHRVAQLREIIGGTNLWCSVDRFRLGQVFRNILENAFAACGDLVRVTVVCSDATLNGEAVRLAVRDNGPGLNSEQQRRIFEPFYTTKTRGSGLGMPIAKRIIEAHGGQMAVGNAPEGGAEISFTLPRREA